jgi:DNA-binding GntR family transcriptional regulator
MAVERLRRAILGGDMAPGQRLVEEELAGMLAVTRASLRAALFDLTAEGLVERIPNRGARVRVISLDEAVAITECRMALEGLCAAKAAERVTESEAGRLLERLNGQLVRHQFQLSLRPGRPQASLSEHLAIISAITERRPAEAEAAARRHLRSVIAALLEEEVR